MAAMATEVELSGIGKEIRRLTESEEYDLAGYSITRATDLMKDAFSTPIPSPTPFRVSFVIGGGKQARQAYDAELGKAVAFALREIGFEEDRGASVSLSCQGAFKTQHDTGKNLMFMHVYPKVVGPDNGGSGSGGGGRGSGSSSSGGGLLDSTSPTYLCCVSELETFQEMVREKTQSWSQRKRMLKALQDVIAQVGEIEAKLVKMQPLTTAEQDLYDLVGGDSLGEKVKWLQKDIKGMLDGGKLTASERAQMLKQVSEKVTALEETEAAEKEGGGAGGAAKDNNTAQKDAAKARYKKIEEIVPVTHSLKHEQEMVTVLAELIRLEKLEGTKGRLLTVKEAQELGAMPDLRAQLDDLKADSVCWFEEDEEFSKRMDDVTKKANAKFAAASKGKQAASKQSPMQAWETVSGKKGSKKR